jgi:hypothetical protein
MDRVQKNGGTAGLVTAVLLALLFVLFFSLGQDIMTPGDPAKSLAATTLKWNLFNLTAFVGLLAAGFAVVFVTGLATKLRDGAPTRARAVLYITLIGLASYALGSTVLMLGGRQIVDFTAKDQAGGAVAWAALSAVHAGFEGLGSTFTGVGAILAGWAILSTKVLPAGAAWVGIISGALGVLGLFVTGVPPVMLGGFLLTIAWLAWAGSALRAS